MVRRAQTKTTAPLHKSHCLWKASGEAQAGGEGVRREKKEGEQERVTGRIQKEKWKWHKIVRVSPIFGLNPVLNVDDWQYLYNALTSGATKQK